MLCILFIPFLAIGQSPDSIRQRVIHTGFHSVFESISDRVLSGNDGFGFEVGAFQERKILDKVSWSYEAGVRYKSYEDRPILSDSSFLQQNPVPDTAVISDFYNVQHDDIKFTTAVSVKFVYIENPRVYFTIGLGPEVTLRQRVASTYLKTNFFNEDFNFLGTSTDRNPEPDEEDFRAAVVNLRFEVGVGIELNKFGIEIVHRTDNTQNIGLKIRYKFNTLTF